MKKNKQGKWIADSPYDLIGWNIAAVRDTGERENWLEVDLVNKTNGEERRVIAHVLAVPAESHFERQGGRR